jgi:hypothetical protein
MIERLRRTGLPNQTPKGVFGYQSHLQFASLTIPNKTLVRSVAVPRHLDVHHLSDVRYGSHVDFLVE